MNPFEDGSYFKNLNKNTVQEIQEEFSNTLFQNQELGKSHNPYMQELRELAAIQNGNLDQLFNSWKENYPGEVGTLAKTSLRHSKNHGIVLTVLASRAAMAGGILPEIAYSLSDIIIRKIEDSATAETAFGLGRYAEYQYTVMVGELKNSLTAPISETNIHIEKCKDYIFAHLHEKIVLSDLAKELFLNKNYLCDLFRKEEGITIGEYILHQKILRIQNLLIYSSLSYSELATAFGFSSQSHLGRQFKKVTGTTLRKYRDTYGQASLNDHKIPV
jgi:YesN/AraC family two-component response regulator